MGVLGWSHANTPTPTVGAESTHPTGMLSCLKYTLKVLNSTRNGGGGGGRTNLFKKYQSSRK